MDTITLLRTRRDDLGLDDDEIESWAGKLEPEFVQALLAALLVYEEALNELAR